MADMDDRRPDPDRLLQQVQEKERRASRGRLTLFFGAAPGVGKTYAMLEAARAEAAQGREVLAGVVETHGRAETGALLAGLPVLPRRDVEYRDIRLAEFDLDAALARRPQLLLVDELAHTNAPGTRHPKRWQDVEELLDAGIDVFTTLNVQHVESLNDVVARITGVAVRETVPDSMIEQAHEVRLGIARDHNARGRSRRHPRQRQQGAGLSEAAAGQRHCTRPVSILPPMPLARHSPSGLGGADHRRLWSAKRRR